MKPLIVTAGPLAAADDNSIADLQLLPAAGNLVFNGVAGSADSVSIAALQSPAGAGNLTLTGTKIYLAQGGQYVYVTCTDDDSARTFTIKGIDVNGAAVKESISGSNTSVTSTTKKFQAVTSVSVDGATADDVSVGAYSPVTFAVPCQVEITPSGDESTNNYIITGLDVNGSAVTEILAGDNATPSVSETVFKTVISIATENTPANALIAGNAESGSTPWVRFDDWAPNYISIQCVADGTIDYTVEYTLDDPNNYSYPVSQTDVTWVASDDTDVVNATGSAVSNFIFAPTFARVKVNSGTGALRATFLQSFGGV